MWPIFQKILRRILPALTVKKGSSRKGIWLNMKHLFIEKEEILSAIFVGRSSNTKKGWPDTWKHIWTVNLYALIVTKHMFKMQILPFTWELTRKKSLSNVINVQKLIWTNLDWPITLKEFTWMWRTLVDIVIAMRSKVIPPWEGMNRSTCGSHINARNVTRSVQGGNSE